MISFAPIHYEKHHRFNLRASVHSSLLSFSFQKLSNRPCTFLYTCAKAKYRAEPVQVSWKNAVHQQNILTLAYYSRWNGPSLQADKICWKQDHIQHQIQWVWTEAGAAFHSKVSPPEVGSLGVRIKPEKVMVACQLLVSPADRAWPQGLAGALVLELAQNPTHDWLFSHKANSQIRRLTKTLLSIVGPSIRRMRFCPPPQVCLPHAELTQSNVGIVTHNVYMHDKSDCLECITMATELFAIDISQI